MGRPGVCPMRCLIVDDNEAFLVSASRFLESQDTIKGNLWRVFADNVAALPLAGRPGGRNP